MITIDRLLVTFSSATTATRVKNELVKNKFRARVIQTPKALTENGCSYSVKTAETALPTLQKTVECLGVKIKRIFIYDGKDYVPYGWSP